MMIVAVIQARMASTRLPGKVMADVCGLPLLSMVSDRVKLSKRVDRVVIATTDTPADEPVVDFCKAAGLNYFRGSEEDVLDRFYQAATIHNADVVVRVTADCPLIDPDVIDHVIDEFNRVGCDYAANCIRYTYPDGLDVEVFQYKALKIAWNKAVQKSEREHVTPYIRFGKTFSIYSVEQEKDVSHFRWTVDVPEDLAFIRKVYSNFSPRIDFRMDETLVFLEEHPEIVKINADITMNEGYYLNLYQDAEKGRAPSLNVSQSQFLFEKSKALIPGSAQTFSKGYTQHVTGVSPVFLERGKGCRVWDVDGNEYIDYIQGLLPNILGYADDRVNEAVGKQLEKGVSFSMPHPLEIELSERLTDLIPCAEMVRFGKNGSDATAGAVRAARAFTGRDRIACCGYHGWQDWYIGSTTRSFGVPKAVCELTHQFPYNDLAALEQLFEEFPGEIAAVIMEPFNFIEPKDGYLSGVKKLTRKYGALLIFDEICIGFHFGIGGAQTKFNVIPDIACFGKALGNGFPLSCIVGRRDIMEICSEIFYSFTAAGEVASIVAGLTVLDILENTDAISNIKANGIRLQDGFNTMAKAAGIDDRLRCVGYPNWSLIQFMDEKGENSDLLRTLFQQEMVKRGILIICTHNLSSAHEEADIEETLAAYASVMKTFSFWLKEDDLGQYLEGSVIEPIFKVR